MSGSLSCQNMDYWILFPNVALFNTLWASSRFWTTLRYPWRVGWRGGATGRPLDLRSTGRRFKSYSEQKGQKLRKNLGHVVHTYMPLSPSSITWYRPSGGDALRLGSLVTCGLTAGTPGSAPGPTLGNEYGKLLPVLPKIKVSLIDWGDTYFKSAGSSGLNCCRRHDWRVKIA